MGSKNALYYVHLMVSLAASLLIITICFNLPIHWSPPIKIWKPYASVSENEGFVPENAYFVSSPNLVPSPSNSGGPSASTIADQWTAIEDTVSEIDSPLISEARSIPVLESADIMPEIRGGLRAYYILIHYPEEAIQLGLEGRLILTFTVNQDGTTSDVMVTEPLHALLDSAAVQALRKTRFVPGQHLGKSARVRMRLPVRFELVTPVDSTLSESLTSEEAS